ncbi:unnamed protein product [Chironomus riparius]|uniref:NACHT domain-containing protein n=1 Tax=Chironomus riparius TaxID=315576 RepID=A0A9N9WYT7_9DIPT|nr:unnamed protein product [Chironomus riparius]
MKTIIHLKNKFVNAFNLNSQSSSTQPNQVDQLSTFDILTSIHDKFVLTIDNIDDIEALRTCKVLKFPSNFIFEDDLAKISELDVEQCPNLFIFTIKVEDVTKSQIIDLHKCLRELTEARLIILQIEITKNNSSTIYYKKENAGFEEIDQFDVDDQLFNDFPTFLQTIFTSKIMNFEQLMLERLPKVTDSALIIRFLRTLNMSKKFYKQLILKCASEGSKGDLLAAINAPLEKDGRMLSCEAENSIKYTISIKDEHKSSKNKNKVNQSVLSAAVASKNEQIIDYLTSYCGHLIQQLPFEHQVQVSTAAFKEKQYEVLCDLVEFCDFPFPENFKPDPTENERFNKEVEERKKFFKDVASDKLNIVELSKFTDNNRNLSKVYNFDNESTLYHALIKKQYKTCFYLKSLGYQALEFDDISQIIEGDELKKARKIEKEQRSENVKNSIVDSRGPVYLLWERSSIHDRKAKSEDVARFEEIYKIWYKDIFASKFGSSLLRVASMCRQLRIVFDFNSDSVEHMSLQSRNTFGSMYPGNRWIFVGAKLSSPNREQQIKGILAHELCHYVMKLTYDNNEEPYFKHDKARKAMFNEIVNILDSWSHKKKKADDKCDKIISGVYRYYDKSDWIAELIVRVPQIFAHYANDPEKLKDLEILYARLFQYYEKFVVPDLDALDLDERDRIRKLNNDLKIFKTISKLNFEFPSSKNIDAIYATGTDVVLTNIPMFLYSELNNHLRGDYGNLINVWNVFVTLHELNNDEMFNEYSEIIASAKNLTIFVDCTGLDELDLTKIGLNELNKFIFICSRQEQYDKVRNKFKQIRSGTSLSSKDYEWKDLSKKSQKHLLQIEIYFQNNKIKIYDILWNKTGKPSAEDEAKICEDFNEIVDAQLLKLMAESKDVSIQTNLIDHKIDDNFHLIFKDRNFIKNVKNQIPIKILQKDLITNTKKEQILLISDIAGTGKSWAMKRITKILLHQHPTKWITYLNLQQFMKAFEAQKRNKLNFLNFMIEKVFDDKKSFELKMFKYLYQNGQACILLDGFDEISPNYEEVVKKLIESFNENGGNQLWIATRDFFQVDLQKHLKLNVSYKLADFTDQDGIDLIIRNCVLNDLMSNKVKIEEDFDRQVKSHPKYQIYANAAIRLHKTITSWSLKSIGLPQLYKMIGDVLIEFEDSTEVLTAYTLYDKFIDHLFKRWYSEKGKLREQKCINNQKEDMNFRELHEFCAMKSLFPENSSFCDLELDKIAWNVEEIVGCGVLNKKTEDGDEFLFPHETYREFFAASFIIRILKMKPKKIDLDVLKYLIKFCLNSKYQVIQMFLWNGFKDIKALPNNKLMIVSTNVPKMLKINIYQYIQKEYRDVENAKNIFVIKDDIFGTELWEDFGDEFIKSSNLKAVVAPSVDFKEELKKLTEKKSATIIIIVPYTRQDNQQQLKLVPNSGRCHQLSQVLQQFKFNPSIMDIKYSWNELTEKSKHLILQDDFSIHNHTNLTLYELLTGEVDSTHGTSTLNDFSKTVDTEILEIIANKSQIKINKSLKYDMESKSFQLLFEPRSFVKITKSSNNGCSFDNSSDDKTSEISKDELLVDVENRHYVLISDVAGTGKTMAVQEITNTLRLRYPKKWVTYVNLSFSSTEFVYCSKPLEFSTFCIEKLFQIESHLKIKECFMNRYNSGNVIFIFDGYDEVANPNILSNQHLLSQIFLSSIKSFEYNGGNQLWIVTKDHMEEILMKELEIDTVYKMGDFSNANGTKLMAKFGILKNIKAKDDYELENKFKDIIKNTLDLEYHKHLASQLVENISISKNSKFTCVAFSILAKNFDNILNKKKFEIFTNQVVSHYKLWINFKCEAVIDRSIGTEAHQINYWNIHHFYAIKIVFPEFVDLLFPGYNGSEWLDQNLILCGLISKKNGQFYFLNETFCAFFIADFLNKNFLSTDIGNKLPGKGTKHKVLPSTNPDNIKIDLLMKILPSQEYKLIRIFLNDVIDISTLVKIKPNLQKFIEGFDKMDNFSELFTNDLEDLAEFVIVMLKQGSYKTVKSILFDNSVDILSNARNTKIFLKFLDLLLDFLTTEDLKDLFVNRKLLKNINYSKLELNGELLADFKTKVQQKLKLDIDL